MPPRSNAIRRLLHHLEVPALLLALLLTMAWLAAFAWGPRLLGAPDPSPVTVTDLDGDGLLDAEEDRLLARYAPRPLMARDEPALPASIGWLRARSDLSHGGPRLLGATVAGPFSAATRAGSVDPADWRVYGHVYPAHDGGIKLQYWMFYSYNEGPLLFDHDSDWEHVTVELAPDGQPRWLALAAHGLNAPGERHAWDQVSRDGTHPRFFVAAGTHAAYLRAADAPLWERLPDCSPLTPGEAPLPPDCRVLEWRPGDGSPLVNVGERGHPLPAAESDGAFLLTYAGLYGAALLPLGSSAPWGPPWQRGFCVDARPGSCR